MEPISINFFVYLVYFVVKPIPLRIVRRLKV
jgi:hypothetical protein